MQRSYPIVQAPNPVSTLRQAGYAYFRDPQSGEESFVLRLTPDFYPRFHVYVKITDTEVTLSLHLDQKQPSYGQGNMHAGEYSGAVIEKELMRIDGWVKATIKHVSKNTAEHDIDYSNSQQQVRQGQWLKQWWKKFFG